mgnify:CR=1 FL=1
MHTIGYNALGLPIGLAAILVVSNGCWKSHEDVSYDRPYKGPAITVTFPETKPQEELKNLQQVTAKSIEPGSQLDIEGTVRLSSPDEWQPVIVEVITVSRNGTPVTTNTAVGMPQEMDDSTCRYQVILKSPMKPGKYFINVRCGAAFVGRAELVVQKSR